MLFGASESELPNEAVALIVSNPAGHVMISALPVHRSILISNPAKDGRGLRLVSRQCAGEYSFDVSHAVESGYCINKDFRAIRGTHQRVRCIRPAQEPAGDGFHLD